MKYYIHEKGTGHPEHYLKVNENNIPVAVYVDANYPFCKVWMPLHADHGVVLRFRKYPWFYTETNEADLMLKML